MTTITPDPAHALVPSGNLQRRMLISRAFTWSATGAAIAAVAVLGWVVFTVVSKGGGQISWHFLTTNPPLGSDYSTPGAGIANAIVGSAIIVALGAVIAVPIGVLTALFATEFASRRVAGVVQLSLDLMNGLPSIVIGVFAYGLLVAGSGQKGIAGSVGLAIIMIPLVARASIEVLRRIPNNLREAADALGISRWRTVVGVVLPTAAGGILTGSLLGIARAAGETAPLLLTNSIFATDTTNFNPLHNGMPNIPVLIFQASEGGPAGLPNAWGAALVLLAFILAANVGARALLARNKAAQLWR